MQDTDTTVPVRILVANGETIVREGLIRLLQDEPAFQIIAEASSSAEVVDAIQRYAPDVLVMALQTAHSLYVLDRIAQLSTRTAVLLLASGVEKEHIARFIQAGGRGMVMRESGSAVLIRAVRAVAHGEYWFDRASLASAAHKQFSKIMSHGLTRRECELIGDLCEGLTNREIGGKMGISEPTVKRHLANIFQKLKVTSRLELAMLALERSLVADAIVPQSNTPLREARTSSSGVDVRVRFPASSVSPAQAKIGAVLKKA